MRVFEIIIEGYKEAEREFSQSGTPEQVKDIIQKYRSLVNRNQVQGNERNIDWWRKQGWDAFAKFVTDKSAQPSKKQVKLGKTQGDVIVLRDDNQWRIVIPLNKLASMREGRGSDWCISKNKKDFNSYTYRKIVPIFCIKKSSDGSHDFNSPMWAITMGSTSITIYDKTDKVISTEKFKLDTGIKIDHITRMIDRDTVSEKILINAVKHDGREIGDISNPSRAIQLAAVQQDGRALIDIMLQHKIVPDDKLKMIAVQQNGEVIQVIRNATEEMKLAAVQQNGEAIQYIRDPSETIQLAAVQQNPRAIRWIDRPTESVQMTAVQQDKVAFYLINWPSKAVKKAAEEAGLLA